MSRTSLFGLRSVPQESEARPDVASWYTPGWSDALGDRLLMFDNTTASGLELLRFSREFGEAPGFEAALRTRVDALRSLDHEGLARCRSVRWLGDGEGLALVSTHVAGRRLSDMFDEAHGASFASELIRQLTPVLVALHGAAPQSSHGTLTAGRIVVTAGGRLVVAEAAVGAALSTLRLPADRLRTELGLAVRDEEADAAFAPAQDIVQLGHVALTLLVGRAIAPNLTTEQLAALLERQSLMPWGPGFAHLRAWLERALCLTRPFSSAREANEALNDWPEGELASADRRPRLVMQPVAESSAAPSFDDEDEGEVFPEERTMDSRPVAFSRPAGSAEASSFTRTPLVEEEPSEPAHAPARRRLVVALGALAAAEAGVIVALVFTLMGRGSAAPQSSEPSTALPTAATSAASTDPPPPAAPAPVTAAKSPAPIPAPAPAPAVPAPTTGRVGITSDPGGARVTVDGAARGVTPLTLSLTAGEHTIGLSSGANTVRRTVTVTAGSSSTILATLGAVGAAGGWVSFDTPLDLQVFEGGSLIGTTKASRLMLPAGIHRLELSNSALGIQEALTVDIPAGRTVSARVAVPNGTLSLNALPWANVLLDGQALGTTPLANLSVPIGTHEVIWRHPQLGERRQAVVVTAKAPLRIVTDLNK